MVLGSVQYVEWFLECRDYSVQFEDVVTRMHPSPSPYRSVCLCVCTVLESLERK